MQMPANVPGAPGGPQDKRPYGSDNADNQVVSRSSQWDEVKEPGGQPSPGKE